MKRKPKPRTLLELFFPADEDAWDRLRELTERIESLDPDGRAFVSAGLKAKREGPAAFRRFCDAARRRAAFRVIKGRRGSAGE